MQAARSLAHRPGFAVGAIVILAAGIAATTGVFSVVDAALLQPLPYPHPDRLVVVFEANSSKTDAAGLLAPGRLEDWNSLNRTFENIAASYAENVTETSGSTPERLAARRVSPRYFAVFGMKPIIGRTVAPEEEASGGPAAAVISDQLWTRRFQRRADVLSQHLLLGGQRYAIVGVMPPTFNDPQIDLWIPAQTSPSLMHVRDARFMTGIGRMKTGVTVEAAQRDLARVQAELGRQYPKTDKDWSAQVTDLKTTRVGQYREPLIFVLGSVALLLAIALANTAGLMLTQLQRRETELAIRGFLGATRVQVVAGVVQEILIVVAVAIGVAVAVDALLLRAGSAALAALPRTSGLTMSWRAFFVASLSGACAALACGAVPAWRATRRRVGGTLSRAGRGISSSSRAQRVLVAGQIAIATLLLSSTGLMLRSYYNLAHVDSGFDASHATTFHVGAAWNEDRVAVGQMQQQLLDALRTIPGVTAAGFSNFLPASNATIRYQVRLQDVGRNEQSSERDALTVGERSVTSDYFQALGAHVVAGTTCPQLASVRGSPPKALVNRRFAAIYAGSASVVAKYAAWVQGPPGPPMEIVGVVDDIREDNLRTSVVPYLYVCIGAGDWPDPEYVVRTAGDPHAVLSAIRSTVRGIAPSRAVFGMMPLDDYLGKTIGQTRVQAVMIAAFGFAAVMLAVIGLYGLVALTVAMGRREIGIRMALGAEPSRVVWELASRVGWLIAGGGVVGLALTAVAQRELRAVVFGVAPLDPATLIGAVLGLGITSALATLIPASRAAKVDPITVMRES